MVDEPPLCARSPLNRLLLVKQGHKLCHSIAPIAVTTHFLRSSCVTQQPSQPAFGLNCQPPCKSRRGRGTAIAHACGTRAIEHACHSNATHLQGNNVQALADDAVCHVLQFHQLTVTAFRP